MILTGNEIQNQIKNRKIIIEPFNPNNINPNSYDFTLGDELVVYKNKCIDSKANNRTETIKIDNSGFVLEPDRIYLGHTQEKMGSNFYVPIIRGRSSTGRMGLFVHITADLIDIGSINHWTLMFHAVQPVRVYPGMLIGQVTFWVPKGKIKLYKGKYKDSEKPMASLSYKDFL